MLENSGPAKLRTECYFIFGMQEMFSLKRLRLKVNWKLPRIRSFLSTFPTVVFALITLVSVERISTSPSLR